VILAELLPGGVAAVEAYDDPVDATLFPEEEELVARAVGKRRREFTTVRSCARTALAKLGLPPVPILHGERGAPVWPAGIVGSMTHCHGYRASAVAHARDVLTIGLDAEPNEPLPEGVLDAESLPEEREMLRRLGAARGPVQWDRLLFSAKESVYKAWFPLARTWLGFEDAEVTINPDDGTFTARVLIDAPIVDGVALDGFTGRWLAREGFVVTAIAVPAR
jgi:4'-phosphopantetheinyl transferase EntD